LRRKLAASILNVAALMQEIAALTMNVALLNLKAIEMSMNNCADITTDE
jgi:hypothetical protein